MSLLALALLALALALWLALARALRNAPVLRNDDEKIVVFTAQSNL